MMKTREARFKKSVDQLSSRLGRAENFLDSELVAGDGRMERIRFEKTDEKHSRASLPTEVYRDKNTLVEVTVHRNSSSVKKPRQSSSSKTWADSLSDSDVQFDKPTKSSLAKRSPRKEKQITKNTTNNKDNEDRDLQHLLVELRDILKVSGSNNSLKNFINDLDKKNNRNMIDKSRKTVDHSAEYEELQLKYAKMKVEAEKYKVESERYKHEYSVMVKQVDISKTSVQSLENQVLDLKKIISRLTKNNGELLDIVKEKIKYEDIIADLEKKNSVLSDDLKKEKSESESLQLRLSAALHENEQLRHLSADMRAHLRSGLSGLTVSKPDSRPASVPALGDVTRRILGVNKPAGDDHDDDDSAYDDPNTESLKSRPRSARPLTAPVSGDHLVTTGVEHHVVTSESPPTRLAGISQLSKSPVRNLFPSSSSDPRAQSRSSTLLDADSIQDDKGPGFQPLPLDMSETSSQLEMSKDATDLHPPGAGVSRSSLEDKVSDFLARLHQDSVNHSLEIPRPRPFSGASVHLSLSDSDIDQNYSRLTNDTTLTEGKFLKGLETSIEVLPANLSKQ